MTRQEMIDTAVTRVFNQENLRFQWLAALGPPPWAHRMAKEFAPAIRSEFRRIAEQNTRTEYSGGTSTAPPPAWVDHSAASQIGRGE